MLKGYERKFRPLELLTEAEVSAIQRAVLDVLRMTGVVFDSKRALEDLDKNGCDVNYEEKRVRFPEYLVEEAIRRCPSSYHVKSRDPKDDLIFGGNVTHFLSFCGMRTVDLHTWEPRDATMQEYYDLVTVLDALPTCDFFCCYPYFGFEGVPSLMRVPEGVAIVIANSTKNQYVCNANDSDQFNIEMIKVTGAEACLPVEGSAPLTWSDVEIRAAYRAIEAGFPAMIMQGTTMGATGPATIAGSAVTNLAQELSMVVLMQLISPGTRLQIGSATWPQNMKTGAPGFGRIGGALSRAVENQVTRSYNIPNGVDVCAGPVSSKKPDFQAGYEKALNGLISALSGSNGILMHCGLYGEITAHPLQAILDDDIAGMIGRCIEGVTASDETIASELIEQVGPIPGQYLGTAHTRKWWAKEQFVPKAADDLTYPEWMKSGKKDCIDYAKERMSEILHTHKVSIPLTPSQEDDIGRILKEARDWYRKQGLITDEEWKVYKEKVLESPDYPFA